MRRVSVFVAAVLAVVAAAAAWSEGSQEGETPEAPRGFAEELITITGPVDVDENGRPVITSEGKTYSLMVPRFAVSGADLDVDQGEKITVEGFAMAQPFWSEWDDESVIPIHVVSAVIDGEEYDLDSSYRGRMPMSRGGMGSRRAVPESRSGGPRSGGRR